MKNKKPWMTLLFLISLSVVACQKHDLIVIERNIAIPNETKPYADRELEDYVTLANNTIVIDLVNGEKNFVLYFGSPVCSSCRQFKPILIEYIEKNQAQIYYYDYQQNFASYQDLTTFRPKVFKDDLLTPSLYFFISGEFQEKRPGSMTFMYYERFLPFMESLVTVAE